MRLTREDKIDLFQDARRHYYLLFSDDGKGKSLLLSSPEELLIPVVEDSGGKEKIIMDPGYNPSYDFRVNTEFGRIYFKILKSKRNLKTYLAILKRYNKFISTSLPEVQSFMGESDLWILLVKTPDGWEDAVVPVSETQLNSFGVVTDSYHKSKPRSKIQNRVKDWVKEFLPEASVESTELFSFLCHWLLFWRAKNQSQ